MKLLRLAAIGLPLISPFISSTYQVGSCLVARAVSRALTLNKSTIYEDLDSFGISSDGTDLLWRADPNDTSVRFLSLTEWGYSRTSPGDDYGLYLIIFNPSGKDFREGGIANFAFPRSSDDLYVVDEYHSYDMKEVDRTSNNLFIKYFISGMKFGSDLTSSTMWSYLSGRTERNYTLSSITLAYGTGADSGQSFALGRNLSVTGFEEGFDSTSLNDATIVQKVSETFSMKVPVVAFSSKLGTMQTEGKMGKNYVGGSALNNDYFNAKSSVNAFSVLFSLPKTVEQYGDLVDVHYNYYKYRSNWILSVAEDTGYDLDLYNQLSRYSGRSIGVYEDRESETAHAGFIGDLGVSLYDGSLPDYGFVWQPFWDLDDRTCSGSTAEVFNAGSVLPWGYSSESSSGTGGTLGYGYSGLHRFYNNPEAGDKHSTLRAPSIGLVYSVPGGAASSANPDAIDGGVLSGEDILQDTIDGSQGFTEANGGLPTLTSGYLNPDLVYLPAYSQDELFYQYGYVNRSIGSEVLQDSIGSYISTFLDQRYAIDGRFRSEADFKDFAYNQYGNSSGLSGSNFQECYVDDIDGFWEKYWSKSIDEIEKQNLFHSNGTELFKKLLQSGSADDLTAYDHLFGDETIANDALLRRVNSNGENPLISDFIIKTVQDSHKDEVQDFLTENSTGNIYRLTYDFGLSNSYRAFEGLSSWPDYQWVKNARKDINVSKTDLVFDFQFIDMTFDDGLKTYTIGFTNDPVSTAPDVDQADSTDGEKINWLAIIFSALAVILVLILLPFIARAVGGIGMLLKYVFKGVFFGIQVILWIPYILIIYPIGRLAKKDMRAWPFGKEK